MAAVGTFTPGGRVGRLIVRGATKQSEISEAILSGSVSLTSSEVSELTFVVSDSQERLLNSHLFDLGARVAYSGLEMSVAAVAAIETNGVPCVEVTARALGVQLLRQDRKSEVVSNLSPTQFVEKLVTSAGLKFYGQPSPNTGQQLTRGGNALQSSGGTTTGVPGQLVESAWEAIVRMAGEVGYIVFEAVGTVYFGRPSWLVTRLPRQTIAWAGPRTVPGLLSRPVCRRTSDDPLRSVTVDMSLLGDAGETIRPGMALKLTGVASFEGTYLISGVTVNLDETVPTTVTAVFPKDPVVPGGGPIGTTSGFAPTGPVTVQALSMDQFLKGLRDHESGGDYGAKPSGRADGPSGAYQYIGSTWNGYGGYQYAWMAPASVQDQRAREDAQRALNKYGGDFRKAAVAHFTGSDNPVINHPENWDTPPLDSSGRPLPGNPTINQYVADVMSKAGYQPPSTPQGGSSARLGEVSAQGFTWPCAGPLTSPFGPRPGLDGARGHQGQDIGVPSGTVIGASKSGTVTTAGQVSGFGNAVYIDHGGGYTTVYGHLSVVSVQVGQVVTTGEQIGLSGNTGHSTGPHLHFGLSIDGTWVDPIPYLPRHGA